MEKRLFNFIDSLEESLKTEPFEAQNLDALCVLHKQGISVGTTESLEYAIERGFYEAAPSTNYGKRLLSILK